MKHFLATIPSTKIYCKTLVCEINKPHRQGVDDIVPQSKAVLYIDLFWKELSMMNSYCNSKGKFRFRRPSTIRGTGVSLLDFDTKKK